MNETQKYELPVVLHNRPLIRAVESGSIAEEMEIEPGDVLLAINGQRISDIIDYYYLSEDEFLVLEVEKPDGARWELEIEKDFDEPLGIEFVDGILGAAKSCSNKCVFCFIDQLPQGMRSTLYFKDDDSRLSFLQGNFVTLTNMSEADIDRIVRYRISPINVSVHTTNPELRCRMLGNRFAGKLMPRLRRFYEAGLTVHAQIVLCPGYNDGAELERTIRDLESLHPTVASIAVVPVGLTKYRDGLADLRLMTREESRHLIEQVHRMQELFLQRYGTRWVFLADEIYIKAEVDFPPEEAYEGYVQYEDGIGMVRKLSEEMKRELSGYEAIPKPESRKRILAVTGVSNYPFLKEALGNYPEITVLRVENDFFGRTITVSGLLTGKDIIQTVRDEYGEEIEHFDRLWLPENMFRSGEDTLLDDWSLQQIGETLGIRAEKIRCSGVDVVEGIRRLYA
ncbi:MAG: DUF512 domain-containing protein [Bacillota bacterium]|nr:DUF512 domain-containing protein [Bacillota bacterium]